MNGMNNKKLAREEQPSIFSSKQKSPRQKNDARITIRKKGSATAATTE